MAKNLVTKGTAVAGGIENTGAVRLGNVVINPGTSSYTITATDFMVIASGACNPIQLPTAAGNEGRILILVSSSGTVAPATGEAIAGSTSSQVFTAPLFLIGSGTTGGGWRRLLASTS